MPESVVLLHGFGGTCRAWDSVASLLERERYLPVALDLPGHGAAADGPRPITFAGCVAHVLAQAPASFTLCGYSLGGRIALQAALAAPERVRRLVLVSSTPGIEDRAARAARRADDERLASELEAGTLAEFVARWRAQPLFAGEPPRVSRLVQEDQLRNRADALAAVLRGVGTGAMPPLWEGLGELEMPVTALAGDRDAKFLEIARRMVERLPDAELLVAAGGHRLHLENPAAVSRAITARP